MLFVLISLSFLAVINTSPTGNDLQNVIRHLQKNDEFKKMKAELGKELRPYSSKLPYLLNDSISVTGKDNSSVCACKGYNCGCCVHLEWDTVNLNDTVCANFSYDPAPEYGISFTVTLDGRTIINETVTARNPPAICVAAPYLKKFASLCVKFGNLTVHNKSLSGCVYFLARIAYVRVEDIKIGCFTIPPGNGTVASDVSTHLEKMKRLKTAESGRPGYWSSKFDSSKLYFKSFRNH